MLKTFTSRTINGVKYQFITLPGSDLFKVEFVNTVGAGIEREYYKKHGKNIFGLSHLIEHLGFRTTKDFQTEQLMKVIKAEGDYNASTNHDRVNYWYKTQSSNFAVAINLVCNVALNDLTEIPEDEFQLEKKVVVNEANRYGDDDQTMFYHNVNNSVCGGHVDDNIIGSPSIIDTFTLDDAIELKGHMMVNGGAHIINIIYDPCQLEPQHIVDTIEQEMARFNLPQSDNAMTIGTLDGSNSLWTPRVGTFSVPNESEQSMTALVFDNVEDIMVAKYANSYLSHYADTSLTDIIREKNGLTYSVAFYTGKISYLPYTYFTSDVSRGDEALLMDLFEQSINASVEAFDTAQRDKFLKAVRLKRVLSNVNILTHELWFQYGMWHPKIVEQHKDILSEDLDETMRQIDDINCSMDNMVKYLKRTQTMVNDQQWGKVHNVVDV